MDRPPKHYRQWTTSDVATLRREYGITNTQGLAQLFGHSVKAVYAMAERLGIRASENKEAFYGPAYRELYRKADRHLDRHKDKARHREDCRQRYQDRKDDPEFMGQRMAAQRRYRATYKSTQSTPRIVSGKFTRQRVRAEIEGAA